MKEFLSCEEQIKLLKNRGLIIEDEETALSILKIENYYNVINGYKELFVEKVDGKEKFIDGVTFEEIYSLYSFDKQIRDVLFQNILKVENHLRSLISYEFSKEYGNDNYLKFSNFDTLSGDLTVPEYKLEERAKFIHELLAGVQQDIASSIIKSIDIHQIYREMGFPNNWYIIRKS